MADMQTPTVRAYNTVVQTLRAWDWEEKKYREGIATSSFDSGTVEDMMKIASRGRTRHYLTMFLSKIEEHLELDTDERWGNVATGVKNESGANEVLASFQTSLTEEYLSWYKPNSTSNAHVEIELYSHEALKTAVKALRGMSW